MIAKCFWSGPYHQINVQLAYNNFSKWEGAEGKAPTQYFKTLTVFLLVLEIWDRINIYCSKLSIYDTIWKYLHYYMYQSVPIID